MVQLVCSRDHKIVSRAVSPVSEFEFAIDIIGMEGFVGCASMAWVCRAVSACVSLCGVCVCGDAYFYMQSSR